LNTTFSGPSAGVAVVVDACSAGFSVGFGAAEAAGVADATGTGGGGGAPVADGAGGGGGADAVTFMAGAGAGADGGAFFWASAFGAAAAGVGGAAAGAGAFAIFGAGAGAGIFGAAGFEAIFGAVSGLRSWTPVPVPPDGGETCRVECGMLAPGIKRPPCEAGAMVYPGVGCAPATGAAELPSSAPQLIYTLSVAG